VLARTLPHSEAAAVTAGRAVLRRLDELAAGRRSFGFEATLASRSFGPRIHRLITAGYECHLVFLWVPSADFAVARVADRVRLGGHTVPEETVSSPLSFGLAEFLQALSDFDHDVADVRQFDGRAAVDRFGRRNGDAHSE
jgi:predicted ABC-type ATPase